MTEKNSDSLVLSEAVNFVCQQTGMTRRQAKRTILKALADGNLPATGFLVRNVGGQMVTTGKREVITPEFWQTVKERKGGIK